MQEFDVVFGFPWDGETDMMLDLMAKRGGTEARLLVNMTNRGIYEYRGGKRQV